MNARIALGKVMGILVVTGALCSLPTAKVAAAGWSGMPVVVSHGVMTAAVPYTAYGSYGGGGPAVVWPASSYPAGYSPYYGACPGGNCSAVPAYNTQAVYYGGSAASCPNGQCSLNSNCPNGRCYISSVCPNGQCSPAGYRNSVFPTNYHTAPAYRGGVASPIYYTVPGGAAMPAVSQPSYYAPASAVPMNPPIGGSGAGASGLDTGVESPFYP